MSKVKKVETGTTVREAGEVEEASKVETEKTEGELSKDNLNGLIKRDDKL